MLSSQSSVVRKCRASQEMSPKSPSSFRLDEYQVASSTYGEAEIHIAQWIFAFPLSCSTRVATTSKKIPWSNAGFFLNANERRNWILHVEHCLLSCSISSCISVRDWLWPFQPVTLWPHRLLDRWKLDFSVQEVVVRWHSCLSLLKNQWIMVAYSASPLE